MPGSAVRSFTDPDDYAASVRATPTQVTLTGRGPLQAKIIRIDLHRLWVQRFTNNLARITHAAQPAGRAFITFSTQTGPSLLIDGVERHVHDLVRHCGNHAFYQRSSGPTGIAGMSLPLEDIASIGAALTGSDLSPPGDPEFLTPPVLHMARLQRLHAAACRVAEAMPTVISDGEAARGLEQSLVRAMVNCIAFGTARRERAAVRRRAAIMRRFQAVVEGAPDKAIFLSELCAAIGVTERTLHRCCHEHLGIGPSRFLLLRRLHLARRRLAEAAPGATNVTQVAMQLGFWELGRFAVAYKSLFGEAPSSTLRRPLDRLHERPAGPPFSLAGIA